MLLALQGDPCAPVRSAYDVVLASIPRPRVIPTFKSVSSILQRKREQCFPPTPNNIDDVVIQDKWARTWNDRPFLCHLDNAWGVAVFMTADHARVLRNCSAIFIDGTFRRLCLHHIHITMQLVTVHGLWMTVVIPLCFCLATGKTVGHYRQILVAVRNSIRMYMPVIAGSSRT